MDIDAMTSVERLDAELTIEHAPGPRSLDGVERNQLAYRDSTILTARIDGAIVGAVRTAFREDVRQHGLITDLQVGVESPALSGALIDAAETHLVERGVTKIDALMPDGLGLAMLLEDRGYWASRKSVVMRFDLADEVAVSPSPDGIEIVPARPDDLEGATDLVLESYQPYWRWWREPRVDRRWGRIDYPADDRVMDSPTREAEIRTRVESRLMRIIQGPTSRLFLARSSSRFVGLCDARAGAGGDHLDFGVLLRRDSGGRGLGSALLSRALEWLRASGEPFARVTTTSGLDDYDPTVYLYNLAFGAVIEAEYVDFVKHPTT